MARHRYNLKGWVRDEPDERDLMYYVSPHVLAALPSSVDLRSRYPVAPFNQGPLGSCGPNSAAGDILFDELQDFAPDIMPSRLFVYWTTRKLMGTVDQDSGVQNRTMLKALAQWGWCDERTWPYVIQQFRTQPSDAAFAEAATRKISKYERIPQNIEAMRGALASGDPFIFGFVVYRNIDQAQRSGDIPMPAGGVAGGHDVLFVGYDDDAARFLIRNSWGTGWGNGGYGTIPYPYALNPQLAGDFWTVHWDSTRPVPPGPTPPPDPGPTPPPNPVPIDWQKIIAFLIELLSSAKTQFCPIWLASLRTDVATLIAAAPPQYQAVLKLISGWVDTLCPTQQSVSLNLSAGTPQPRPVKGTWEDFKRQFGEP